MGQQRRLLANEKISKEVRQEVDVRNMMAAQDIMDAFETLFFAKDTDALRAVGPAPMGGQFVEIVLEEGPLRQAMWRYSRNVLLISVAVSAITAVLLYFTLHSCSSGRYSASPAA